MQKRIYTKKLIYHSDRWLQYCSAEYTKILQTNDIGISMTEKSDSYENTVAERINGILKDEFRMDENFENKASMERQLKQAITLYNQLRPYLPVNFKMPNQAHKQQKLNLNHIKTKKGSKLVLNP